MIPLVLALALLVWVLYGTPISPLPVVSESLRNVLVSTAAALVISAVATSLLFLLDSAAGRGKSGSR